MRRLLLLLCSLLLLSAAPAGAQRFLQGSAHITTQTTTTVVAAVAANRLALMGGSVCVDAGGATTGVALQDSAGTNLFGTGIVWAIGPGSCLNFPIRVSGTPIPYGTPTALGTSLQIVTTVGNGPVEVSLEVERR